MDSYLWNHKLNHKKDKPSTANICDYMKMREVNGASQRKNKFFYVMKLKKIINPAFINERHIYLGFSGCSKFILSYTSSPEFNVNIHGTSLTLYSHAYILHWWKFTVHGYLSKVSSVKLFANEEIVNDLNLCYLEWPQDKSKILVCGWEDGKSYPCYYVTVATTPSLNKCSKCHREESKILCKQHGFSAHFKYQMPVNCSPRTRLLNLNSVKINGLVVLNMSHCITVLSVGTAEDKCNDLPLSSIKKASFEESVSDHNFESYQLDTENVELETDEKIGIESNFCESISLFNKETNSKSITCESEGSLFCEVRSIGGTANCTNKQQLGGPVSFAECFYGRYKCEEQNISSDVNSLFCSTIHCVADGGLIFHPRPLDDDAYRVEAYSQNCVLDLEYVIFDILRTRCYNTYRYGYLRDYEANIIDVCPDLKSVVVHIAAFIEVRLPMANAEQNLSRALNGKTQSEFIINWSLKTGRYEVVLAFPFVLFDEKKRGKWNPNLAKFDQAIILDCYIPVNMLNKIYMLTNKAVHRGKSLEVIWNCNGTLALKR